MSKLPLLIFAASLVTACAPSPHYVADSPLTPGEVPRDGYGRPVLEAMTTPPPPRPLADPNPAGQLSDIPDVKPLPTSPDRPVK